METTLALFTVEDKAQQRLETRLRGFREKHSTKSGTPSPASVSHVPIDDHLSPISLHAAEALFTPPQQMDGKEAEAGLPDHDFWRRVFGEDAVLHESELVVRTRKLGEREGYIHVPIRAEWLKDSTQDTLALNLIHSAEYEGLITPTKMYRTQIATIYTHNYEYQLCHDQSKQPQNILSTEPISATILPLKPCATALGLKDTALC